MTRDQEQPDAASDPTGPTEDPRHPLADAGRPVSEAEARKNQDRDPPA
jgi:hypothetical protein